MKKQLLFAFALFTVLAAAAQNYAIQSHIKAYTAPERNVDEGLFKTSSIANSFPMPAKPVATKSTNQIVTIIPLGGAANAFGLYNGGRTALWADNNIKAVAMTHRMLATPGSGHLAYDWSINGGTTWTLNTRVYNPAGTPPGSNGRYPQGVIYNPVGNTNPANAYYAYFAPTLDGSNGTAGSWGGYCRGSHKLDQSTAPTQSSISTLGAFRQNVPAAMHINPVNGNIWVYEPSLVGGIGSGYIDTLIISKGVFNNTTKDWDYTRSLMYAKGFGAARPSADEKIAFAPNGLIGYMSLLWDNGGDAFARGRVYYPVLYKTVDGGQTWTGPVAVVMSGPNGLPEIKNYLTADQWNSLWTNPSAVLRDSVRYTTAFDHDLAVDMNGNPHICVTIGVGSTTTAYSIVASGGYGATFHIYSLNQGQTWIARYIQHNKTFRGEFTGGASPISEDSRSQISTTMDGSKLFFSWLDTDFSGVTDNTLPDIWCQGYDVVTKKATTVRNVTYLSDGWTESFMGTASYYVFQTGANFVVPFVFQTLGGGTNPDVPVTYRYVSDFTLTNADFTVTDIKEINDGISTLAKVTDNYPNPFLGVTRFTLNLSRPARVSIEVLNLMGQRVMLDDRGLMNAQSHVIYLDMASQPAGLYFYKVMAGNQTITKKMIVQ